MNNHNNGNPANLSISSLAIRAALNPDNILLQHVLWQARLDLHKERGIEVSDCDVDLLRDYTWSINNCGYPSTSMSCPREYANITRTFNSEDPKFKVTLNRVIAARQLGVEPWLMSKDLHGDHINEDLGLRNCRRDNIQPLTISENVRKSYRRKEAA